MDRSYNINQPLANNFRTQINIKSPLKSITANWPPVRLNTKKYTRKIQIFTNDRRSKMKVYSSKFRYIFRVPQDMSNIVVYFAIYMRRRSSITTVVKSTGSSYSPPETLHTTLAYTLQQSLASHRKFHHPHSGLAPLRSQFIRIVVVPSRLNHHTSRETILL